MFTTVSVGDLEQLLDSEKDVLVVDVRKPHDFTADPVMIPGATRRLPDQVDSWRSELNADTQVIAYCVHGHAVSKGVVDALRERGLSARLLEGGIEAWKEAGNDTITG